MCEEEEFVWVTWVGNKNSSYNNKTHKIPKETLVDPPTKLEVGTPVHVYWDKDRFRKFWSAVVAEPKLPKIQQKRKRAVENNDGSNSSVSKKNKKGKNPAPCKFIDDGCSSSTVSTANQTLPPKSICASSQTEGCSSPLTTANQSVQTFPPKSTSTSSQTEECYDTTDTLRLVLKKLENIENALSISSKIFEPPTDHQLSNQYTTQQPQSLQLYNTLQPPIAPQPQPLQPQSLQQYTTQQPQSLQPYNTLQPPIAPQPQPLQPQSLQPHLQHAQHHQTPSQQAHSSYLQHPQAQYTDTTGTSSFSLQIDPDVDDTISILSEMSEPQWGAHLSRRPSTPPLLHPPIAIPHTPKGDKIRRIIGNRRYRDVSKAGRMAVALATDVYFNNDVLRKSGLTSDHGRLEVLDSASMVEIEDLIRDFYRSKVRNTDDVWAKARMAIAKKCQSLRK